MNYNKLISRAKSLAVAIERAKVEAELEQGTLPDNLKDKNITDNLDYAATQARSATIWLQFAQNREDWCDGKRT